MKSWLLILFAAVLISCGSNSTSSSPEVEYVFLDENSEIIDKEAFLKRWRDDHQGLMRWDYIEENKRHAKLDRPVFYAFTVAYPELQDFISNSTGKQFDDNSIFLINYHFKDDLCTTDFKQKIWDEQQIKKRKGFLNRIKKDIEQEPEPLVYLHFFEEGVPLENTPEMEGEYFFMDKQNYLRKSIFKKPALCGAFAVVKPNGQLLLRQGEYRVDWMLQYLKQENWRNFTFIENN